MLLELLHPEVANRDCNECQKWMYEDSGAKARDSITGEPIPRASGVSTACRLRGKGCPKGMPDAQKSLTPQNQKAYRHYLECKATNQWPNDAIVKRHAGIISSLERQVEHMRQQRMMRLLEGGLGGIQ